MYETKFEDGTIITAYLASAFAEGFCEGEGASVNNRIRAWSYLIGTGQVSKMQGWYGRNAASIIEQGMIDVNGTIDWPKVEELTGG